MFPLRLQFECVGLKNESAAFGFFFWEEKKKPSIDALTAVFSLILDVPVAPSFFIFQPTEEEPKMVKEPMNERSQINGKVQVSPWRQVDDLAANL